MKKSNLFANCVFAVSFLLVAMSFTACSDDSNDVSNVISQVIENTETPFSVVLKAINSEGNDITPKGEVNSATLFVFDQNNDFVKQVSVEKSAILNRSAIQIECPNTNKITVIAWSGISSSNEQISSLSQANIISDLQVSLKNNNGVASIPSDLFYGQATIQKNNTKAGSSSELTIARKTSVFNLTTKGLIKYMGDTKGEYIYKIKKTRSSFDYNGQMTGEEVEYVAPASFDSNGNLVAASMTILPSDQVTVELYKDGNLLFSSKNDQNGEIMSAKAGKQSDIIFKYSNTVSTNVLIADWGTVIQHVTIG